MVGTCWIVENICSSTIKLFYQIKLNQTINPKKVSKQWNFCDHILPLLQKAVLWMSLSIALHYTVKSGYKELNFIHNLKQETS